MRMLSTDAAALALGIEKKSLDNILSREGRSLLPSGRRGRGRRIPMAALERVAIALILDRDLGVGLANGLELAGKVLGAPTSSIQFGSLGTLSLDVESLRRKLDRSIE